MSIIQIGMNYITVSSVFVFVCVLLLTIYLLKDDSKLPPGPFRWPLVGNLFMMRGKNFLNVFKELRKQYGDVIYLELGTRPTVILNGYDTIHETLVKSPDEFSDRVVENVRGPRKGHGLLASSGELWKKTRTFTIANLRDFGFGKKSLESKILEEVHVFLDTIQKTEGASFCMDKLIQISVCNVICSIINGKRYDHDDEDLRRLLHLMDENFRSATPTSLNRVLQFLRYIPFDPFKVNKPLENVMTIWNFHKTIVDEHRKTFNENETRDLIDTFLKGQTVSDSTVFSETGILSVIFDLYVAGTETTSTTIRWAVVYLLHNPEVQQCLHDEISDIIGTRVPSMNDKSKMPYFQAFITEVLRMANIVPLAVPHSATVDINYKGYIIPKGALILPNLDSITRDENLFDDPDTFNPSRFINKKGEFDGHQKVAVFGLGRRVCLGEALARMELFLFLSSLVQRFQLQPDGELPPLEGVLGITNAPVPFRFHAVSRQ